jgi:hypothetical protein
MLIVYNIIQRFSNPVARVWVRGAKTTGPIAKVVFLINFEDEYREKLIIF